VDGEQHPQSIQLNAACRGSRKIASTWPARRCREYVAAKGVKAICCMLTELLAFLDELLASCELRA